MATTLKFGGGQWATKEGSALTYNDENNNFKPLPFDFTRASSATRVNKDGLIEVVGIDKPRIDYLGNSSGAMLLEPSRTNLLNYSEAFDNSYWTKINAVVTSNQSVSPDGSQTAYKYRLDCTGSRSQILMNIYSVGTQYTTSLFVKYDSVQYFYISNAGAGAYKTVFDIKNGTIISTGSSVDASKIENYGNGWYRCSATFTAAYTTLYYSPAPNSNGATFTNTTDFNYIWGAQVEQGSYATSYIPTQGGAVTRLADSCSGAGNASTFNDSEGVLMIETSALADDLNIEGISISDGSISNRVVIFKWDSSNSIRARVTSSGVNTLNQTINISDVTTLNKIAIKYKLNDFAIWINGIKLFTDTSGSTPIGLNKLQFNSDGIDGAPFYGNIKQVQYFDTALTDAELAALTS